MTISTDNPVPRDTVDMAFLVNQAVLFDESTGAIHELSPSASAVWMLIDGATSVDQIAIELSAIFDVPLDEIRSDCRRIVDELGAIGLLADRTANASDAADFGDPSTTDGAARAQTTEVLHPPLEP